MKKKHDAEINKKKKHDAEINKPSCQLVGTDGNVYSVIGNVCRALKQAGQHDSAAEFKTKAFASESYDAVLALCFEYVEVE